MIYLVKRTDDPDYEENRAVVVRATSTGNARSIAAELGNGFRADGSNMAVTPIPGVGPEKVVLTDNVGA